MRETIMRFRGRVVDSPGANLLAEFSSAVHAEAFAKDSIIQVQWALEYDSPGCATFDILLSRDGGVTYADTLATQVDLSVGSWNVKLPNVSIPHAQIELATQPGQFPARSGIFKVN